jgi:hypothetical protein
MTTWRLDRGRSGKAIAYVRGTKTEATAAAQRLANRLGTPVAVLPNPTRTPRVGEVWRGVRGDRCRILSSDGNRVTVLQLSSGDRVTSDMADFLASYKPPVTPPTANPKRKGRKRAPRQHRVLGPGTSAKQSRSRRGVRSRSNPKGRKNPHGWKAGDRFYLVMPITTANRHRHEKGEAGTVTLPQAPGTLYVVFDSTPYVAPEAIAARWASRVAPNPSRSATARHARKTRAKFYGSKRQERAYQTLRRQRGKPGELSALARLRYRADSTARRIQRAKWRTNPRGVETGKTKIALRREPGYPIGTPAPMHAICACGQRLDFPATAASVKCSNCGRKWSAAGWLIGSPRANPRGRKKPWIVGGRTRYATKEEALAAAARIHQRTGVFAAVEYDGPSAKPVRPNRRPKRRSKRVKGVRGKAHTNPRESALARARRTFTRLNENEPGKVTKVRAPRGAPPALAKLGELVSFRYRSDKYAGSKDNPHGKPQLYEHRTKRPHPVLATDPSGREVWIVGGRMHPTPDGLVN